MPKSTSKTRSRRSLHITPANTKALNAIAKLRGISFNAALNVALAEALGKPVPAKAFREAQTASAEERHGFEEWETYAEAEDKEP